MNKFAPQRNSGFTLTEVSIVIVLIAMLTAGVVSANHIINQTKLRNVIKEFQTFESAMRSFNDKFHYMPGDFPNAAKYWSTTTSGDGDWQIEYANNSSTPIEDLLAWQHLGLGGFVESTFTGAVAGTRYTPGTNAPASVISGGGYEAIYLSLNGSSGNLLAFGSSTSNANGHLNGPIFTPQDTYYIDSKLDDGLAASGAIYASVGNGKTAGTSCVTATNATAAYIFSDSTVSCRIFYWLDKK